MGVKFGTEEGSFGPLLRLLLRAEFHPHRCNVSPLRGEKPQNRPLSKLNTGRLALRAMLPVKIREVTRADEEITAVEKQVADLQNQLSKLSQ